MQGRRADLLDRILNAYLPRLHLWQLAKFSEPATWHAARLAFTRTCAVWCMASPASSALLTSQCCLACNDGCTILAPAPCGDWQVPAKKTWVLLCWAMLTGYLLDLCSWTLRFEQHSRSPQAVCPLHKSLLRNQNRE